MKRSAKNAGMVLLLGTSLVFTGSAQASASSVTVIRSGDGDTLRAIFYEHANFKGAELRYYGSSACTGTTTDADFSLSAMPFGWNDVISSVKDYNSCDVRLYVDGAFGGATTGYVNYGSAGKNLSASWNDKTSSFRVS